MIGFKLLLLILSIQTNASDLWIKYNLNCKNEDSTEISHLGGEVKNKSLKVAKDACDNTEDCNAFVWNNVDKAYQLRKISPNIDIQDTCNYDPSRSWVTYAQKKGKKCDSGDDSVKFKIECGLIGTRCGAGCRHQIFYRLCEKECCAYQRKYCTKNNGQLNGDCMWDRSCHETGRGRNCDIGNDWQFEIDCGVSGHNCGNGCRDYAYEGCEKECCESQKKHCNGNDTCMVDRNCIEFVDDNVDGDNYEAMM